MRPSLPLARFFGAAAALALFAAGVRDVPAQDGPHDASRSISCSSCHLTHSVFGKQLDYLNGNDNLCTSCHAAGGSASDKPLTAGDQARHWIGPSGAMFGTGTSHRWDSSCSGQVTGQGGTPSDGIVLGGAFKGPYARSYTLTITTGGGVGTARFDWSADAPGTGGGTNLTTGANVPLADGLTVSFLNFRPPPGIQVGDRWKILARPDLTPPSHAELLFTMPSGAMICSTCHDQHSQSAEPFDPAAPAFVPPNQGAGRHFMRLDNDTDQMCAQCHGARFVTNALAGSHPVGVRVPTNSAYHPPTSLPLDKHEGRLWCSTCHTVHDGASADGNLLRVGKETQLCAECHAFAGNTTTASHLLPSDGTLWPGGQYGSLMPAATHPDHRGSCGNCHRVHGTPDGANPTNDYPALLVEREENLCFTCHDGSPVTKNLKANFTKTYKHPVAYAGRHNPDEAGNPARYGTANRHSECADCHNPHALGKDNLPAAAPAASKNLAGVARVSVSNASPTQVVYTYRGPDDPAPVKEYEVCFTCHSSWTTQPSGQSNLAADFNTKAGSFHPVEGPGRNLNINANAFVNGWTATSMVACSDCHGSDDVTLRGPHASTNQFILKKRTVANPARRATTTLMASDEMCFTCHNFDTYANNSASTTVKNYSRFSGAEGHGYHVSSRRYSCYNCHETHGSRDLPNLLVTGRSPGLNTYTRTTSGGTCAPTCHGSESYSVTYPR